MEYILLSTNLFFMLCILSGLVITQDFYNLSGLELIQLLTNVVQVREGDVKDSDLTFSLFTRSTSENPRILSNEKNNGLDLKKQTKFIIHGWVENHKVGWYGDMKNELLKNGDFHVIYVDWQRVAKSYYISAAKNTKLVGEIIGRFLKENKLPPNNIHLIGHSLGSHVAAFAAKYFKKATGSRIKRITALDPAGPYFRLPDITEDEKLNKEDAEIVDVIHTDSNFLGLESPSGTLDIYVNGGSRRQPGCKDGRFSVDLHEFLINTLCSHARSHEFFTQSLNNANITCKKCENYDDVINNDCSENNVYKIVHQKVTPEMVGICAAHTGSSPPYFN